MRLTFVLPVLCTLGAARAEPPDPGAAIAEKGAEAKEKVVDFTTMKVYPKARRIEIEGEFCLDAGLVEFLIVRKGGKDYESLLSADSKPSDLKVALGLIGLKESKIELEDGLVKSVPEDALENGAVGVMLKWRDRKGAHRSAPEALLIRRNNRKADVPVRPWIFTGSFVAEIEQVGKVFAGDYHRSAAGIWYDPAAVINYSVRAKNPYWDDACGFEVDQARVPPRGTRVLIVLTPWKRPGADTGK